MRRLLILLGGMLAFSAQAQSPPPTVETPSPPSAEVEEEEKPKTFNAVTLKALNKVTARVSRFEVPFGIVERFGTLEIIVHSCWQAPADERPENAALLEVRELKPDEPSRSVFRGWMFSSSPGLSALEHPVYDLTVVACVNSDLTGVQ